MELKIELQVAEGEHSGVVDSRNCEVTWLKFKLPSPSVREVPNDLSQERVSLNIATHGHEDCLLYHADSQTCLQPSIVPMLWRLFNSGKRIAKYNHDDAWAFVTGSSDGIGKGIATELLTRGFNVFIHGRNPEKLSTLKDELAKQFPDRSIEYVVADASHVDSGMLEEIARTVQGKNLTVLVNNVAWVGGEYDALENTSYEVAETACNVNVRFLTHITRTLLPVLTTHEPSLIINVSSLAGKYPFGFLSLYSASKAYMVALSRSLVHELAEEKRKIEVLVVELHYAQSNSNKSAAKWDVPSPQTMSKAIVDSVGHGGQSVVVTPYWGHELVGMVLKLMPRSAVENLGTRAVVKDLKSTVKK